MIATKYIKIYGLADVTNFIQEATRVEGDVTLKRGKYVIDGKSLMGIMSIDVSQGVTVEYPSDAIEFDTFLNQFV